jgi:predicted dehydrogenase
MTIASDHKVPVVVVEKPIAVAGEDWRLLRDLGQRSPTRFVVNTQLHFHPRSLELKKVVAGGGIGEVRFIDVSARSTILDQGVHVLELAHSYNGYSAPTAVFAQVCGARTLATRQPSPDTAEASIAFANGVRAHMATGDFAPRAQDDEVIYRHKRIAVYGTRGFVHWTMAGWECRTESRGYESGAHSYAEQDVLGQASLTDSAFALLDGEGEPHPTRLEVSLVQFNVILGAYVSALEHRPVALPCEPPDGLLARLGKALA